MILASCCVALASRSIVDRPVSRRYLLIEVNLESLVQGADPTLLFCLTRPESCIVIGLKTVAAWLSQRQQR